MTAVELVTPHRFWPCRLFRHGSCPTVHHSPRAVAYLDPWPAVAVVGWLRCPCKCHGKLPVPTGDQEPLADWERELICRRCGASGCGCDARCGDVHGSGDVCNRPTNHPGWHHVDGSGGLGWED